MTKGSQPVSNPALSRRGGVDGERMHAAGEFAGQKPVDHAVALEAALPFEGVRHDIDPEMGLPARLVPGMALVAVGFILHFQALRRESFGEFLRDNVGGAHAVPVRQRRVAGQCLLCGGIALRRLVSSLEGVIGVGA